MSKVLEGGKCKITINGEEFTSFPSLIYESEIININMPPDYFTFDSTEINVIPEEVKIHFLKSYECECQSLLKGHDYGCYYDKEPE